VVEMSVCGKNYVHADGGKLIRNHFP
jgi:hypothetical protein